MSLFGWWKQSDDVSRGDDTQKEGDSSTQGEERETAKEEQGKQDEAVVPPNSSAWDAWGLSKDSLSKGMTGVASSVKGYATNISTSVATSIGEVSSVFNELNTEQEKFERKKRHQKDAAVPPWVGYNEEEEMRKQILELSADQRNFLRAPPPGVQFSFEFAQSYPVAMALLEEDQRLQKMRFEFVPKKISEVDFWRNLFYRISLIKQAIQISSANKVDDDKEEPVKEENPALWQGSSPGERPVQPGSASPPPPQHEFASDELVASEDVSSASIRQELQDLGMSRGEGGGGEPPAPGKPSAEAGQGQGQGEGRGQEGGDENWESVLQEELDQLSLEGGEEEGLPEDTEGWERELEQLLDHKT